MSRFQHVSRVALLGAFASAAFVAAPFAVASGHREAPPRVLLAQAEGAAPPAAQEAPAAPPPAPVAPPPPVSPPAAAAQAPTAPPPPAVPPPAAQQAAADSYSRAEIEKLVAPIALYPDALLAQTLAATAYPLDVVQAARWIERNKTAVSRREFDAVDQQRWDESVKALTRFPEVIRKLNDDVDWMTDLGEAFVNQPKDVADAIQDLRQRAEAKGALQSSQQQRVVRRQESGRDYVIIEPVEPERIYVPVYDPVALWWPAPGFVWGGGPWITWPYYGLLAGVLPAAYYWGWGSGWAYPPYWPGYRGWRPGVGHPGGPHRWEPNRDRFRPELVSKRSNQAINRYGATSPGGRRIQSNMNAQQRTQRATRELTRAGGKTQQLSRQKQTRAQMGSTRNRNMSTQNRISRQQATRMNRATTQRTMRAQSMRGPSMRTQGRSFNAGRSFNTGRSFSGGRSFGGGRSGGGGGRGGGRGFR